MTKEKLKNILIENKCIASGDWDNENPFVGIDLDVLCGIFEKEKQQLIQEYEDKLNKLNQKEETFRDNVRKANSRHGFEGLF